MRDSALPTSQMANRTDAVVADDDAGSCLPIRVAGRFPACRNAQGSGTCHAEGCKGSTGRLAADTSDSSGPQSMDLWEGPCQT